MADLAEILVRGALIGLGATACMDLWALVLRRAFGIRGLDYALLGRWVGHATRGRWFHDRIASSAPIRGERILGWIAHESIGITFALLLLAIFGLGWARSPSIGPALAVGLVTILGPWLVMQPGMGAGIAASRTPNPGVTRVRNLATHAVYGIGLCVAALVLASVWQ